MTGPAYATTWRLRVPTPPSPHAAAEHPRGPVSASSSPVTLSADARALLDRARRTTFRVPRVLSPAVAALVVDEIEAWISLAGRLGGNRRIAALLDEIDALPERPRTRPAPVVAPAVAQNIE